MAIDLTIKEKNIELDFNRIANELMNYWILKIESKSYRITEIEFYLKSEPHNDNYTHGHQLQKENGKWYFHGSGVDMTFGSNKFYGGILIRAIYDMERDIYVYGPLNCVTELFSNITNVYETNFLFGLAPARENSFEIEKPIAAPRVGLNEKTDQENYNALYRFLIMPKKKHAEKSRIVAAMKQYKYTEAEIKNIWG